MDWSKSYNSQWRVYRVNRRTWADGEALSNVDSFNITRTADGSLLESGSFTVTGDFVSDYYRVVMIAEQGGEIERVNVATLLFDLTGGKYDHKSFENDLDGFSVLYPASVTAITMGDYAPAGADGAQYAADLLATAINAPVQVDGSFVLNDNIVHEVGASVLECVWDVLIAGGFVIQIDGEGTVHILKKPDEPSLILNSYSMELLSDGIKYTADMSEIPNRYLVIDEGLTTIAVNDNPDSIVSTVSRGYNVDVIDTSPTLVNGETYSDYANRMLKQSSVLQEKKTYKREYAPDVYPYSIVRGSITGLDGDLRVKTQSITCDHGIIVNEQAVKETALW